MTRVSIKMTKWNTFRVCSNSYTE